MANARACVERDGNPWKEDTCARASARSIRDAIALKGKFGYFLSRIVSGALCVYVLYM